MFLKDYVPAFIKESSTFSTIYDLQQEELDSVNGSVLDIVNQCFVNKATWGLELWERFCGIPTNTEESTETRRCRISAKISQVPPITSTSMLTLVSNASGLSAGIIDNTAPYTFRVVLHAIGQFLNLEEINKAIEDAKPAHLQAEYEVVLQQGVSINSNMVHQQGGTLVFCGTVNCGAYPENLAYTQENKQYTANINLTAFRSIGEAPWQMAGTIICGEGIT